MGLGNRFSFLFVQEKSPKSRHKILKMKKLEKDPFMTQKLSKATILQNTIDHIQVISEKKSEDEKQLERLHREVKGMKIMLNELGGMIKKQRAVPSYQSYHRYL